MRSLALALIVALVACAQPDEPLMMTAADVWSDWPFRADAVRVSCCYSGQVVIIGPGGQVHGFAGSRFARSHPVTRLGVRDGMALDDFADAHAAAVRLARARWPEQFRSAR